MSIYTLQDLKSVQTGMQRMPVGVLPPTLAENFGAHVDAMLGADSGAAPMVASRAAAQRAYEWLQERTGRDPVDLGTEAATELTSQALAERRREVGRVQLRQGFEVSAVGRPQRRRQGIDGRARAAVRPQQARGGQRVIGGGVGSHIRVGLAVHGGPPGQTGDGRC